MTHTKRALATLGVALALLAACGDDDTATSTTPSSGSATTTAPGGDTTSTGDATTTSEEGTTTTSSEDGGDSSTTGQLSELEQPAIWPAADVVFATPEEATADFVTNALGVPAELGEFQQGDARSGEIEVFSPGEGEQATPITRGLLLLRKLGTSDGWFVIAAVNDNASITSPSAGAEVEAGPLSVEGVGRGFEANVVVRAFVAGDAGAPLDEVITQGGAFETPEPFSISVDLGGAAPGGVVMLLVRGGTGLETDPGDFGAIPVVVAG